jgi:glycosyltransferase involved in cell wall biosynthesis
VITQARLAVIMPAFNEAGNIERSVREVREAMPHADVIVINDGSTDDTARVARAAGAAVLDLPHNLGIGGAVQTGYKFATEHGYSIVARLDGDGQHDPRQLAQLLEPVLRGEVDIAIGSRFVNQGGTGDGETYRASRLRGVGIVYFARLVSLIIQQRVTDTTSGFQVCNASVARFFSRNFPCDYPEVEAIAVLGRMGYRIREVPVQMRRRLAGQSSLTPLRSAYYVLKVTISLLIGAMRVPTPRTHVADLPRAAAVGVEAEAA